jgi:hypothetical protein
LPKYIPIIVEGIDADPTTGSFSGLIDLLEFHWGVGGIRASFAIMGRPDAVLHVSFEDQCIVRLLDDTALSTEDEDSPSEGLVPNHFAYLVEGALFFRVQSELFKVTHPPCAHYRVLTGWTCLDVVTAAEPHFTIVHPSESPLLDEC